MKNIEVSCYSGSIYAERPQSFSWGGVTFLVKEITDEWIEPGERYFRVRTGDNKSFQLCYNETNDKWSIIELAGGASNAERDSKNTGK